MKSSQELFSHFAIVFPVRDISKSMEFYQNKLGFEITFTWNDPVDYAVLKRGEHVSVHLTRLAAGENNTTHTSMYVFVHDVDAVYQELRSQQVEIYNPIADRDYGMRDFDIKDPDGNILTFGKGIH